MVIPPGSLGWKSRDGIPDAERRSDERLGIVRGKVANGNWVTRFEDGEEAHISPEMMSPCEDHGLLQIQKVHHDSLTGTVMNLFFVSRSPTPTADVTNTWHWPVRSRAGPGPPANRHKRNPSPRRISRNFPRQRPRTKIHVRPPSADRGCRGESLGVDPGVRGGQKGLGGAPYEL